MQRVAVVFDEYLPMHENRDPAEIVRCLRRGGYDALLVTMRKLSLSNYDTDFPVVQLSPQEMKMPERWRDLRVDMVIAYWWLQGDNIHMLRLMEQLGIKVIIKGDTAGQILPRGHLGFFLWESVYRNDPRIILKALLRWGMTSANERVLRKFQMVAAVVVETPVALSNISRSLSRYQMTSLADKLAMIPNPINLHGVCVNKKNDWVILVGRWDDPVKGFRLARSIIREFLVNVPKFQVIIVGQGHELWKRLISTWPVQYSNRITITGPLPHDRVLELMSYSKIFLSPSQRESFGLSAAEAVSLGCSVVVPPVPSLKWFALQGQTGTISQVRSPAAMLRALMNEVTLWDKGLRRYDQIIELWRPVFKSEAIAESYSQLLIKQWGNLQ